MYFKPKYEYANLLIEDFLKNKILSYSKDRNFVYFGNDALKNVSGLSPYISCGFITEKYLLKKVINSKNNCEKFIQEIFWRIYWQGWLENYKNIWKTYNDRINFHEDNNLESINNYLIAISAETGIKPFDEWVTTLKQKGYLHNHVRMWFASIWIHYLNIPWQLGAKFFHENLLDADTASNLLSWRWVAGIQTVGKKYIASIDNINKFTHNHYKKFMLPKVCNINLDTEIKQQTEISFTPLKKSYKNLALLVPETNLSLNLLNRLREDIKLVILIRFNISKLKKSKIVIDFHDELLKEFVKYNLSKKVKSYEIFFPDNTKKINQILINNNIENLIFEYFKEGYEKNIFYKELQTTNKKIIKHSILDSFYQNSWVHCKKGFFKFKEKIPLIIRSLK